MGAQQNNTRFQKAEPGTSVHLGVDLLVGGGASDNSIFTVVILS